MSRRIEWRRVWDGARFTGTVLDERPEYRCLIVERDDTKALVAVHVENVTQER